MKMSCARRVLCGTVVLGLMLAIGGLAAAQSKGKAAEKTAAPAAAPVNLVDETQWTVNNHPVPWIFHANGKVEAPGLWTGTWTKDGSDYKVTLVHQGATDSFTVRFNPDGKAFTAYKGASVYRKGVRNN